MKKLLMLVLVLALGACSNMTPEQKLDKGFKASSATVKATTVLLDRQVISSAEAQRVHDLGHTARDGLDADTEALAKCRRTPGATCDDTNASISLYSGVLQQLETFLKAKGAQ